MGLLICQTRKQNAVCIKQASLTVNIYSVRDAVGVDRASGQRASLPPALSLIQLRPAAAAWSSVPSCVECGYNLPPHSSHIVPMRTRKNKSLESL